MAFKMKGYKYPGKSPLKQDPGLFDKGNRGSDTIENYGKKYSTTITGTAYDKAMSDLGEYSTAGMTSEDYHLMNRIDRRAYRKKLKAQGRGGLIKDLKGPSLEQQKRNVGRVGFRPKDMKIQRLKNRLKKKHGGQIDMSRLTPRQAKRMKWGVPMSER